MKRRTWARSRYFAVRGRGKGGRCGRSVLFKLEGRDCSEEEEEEQVGSAVNFSKETVPPLSQNQSFMYNGRSKLSQN